MGLLDKIKTIANKEVDIPILDNMDKKWKEHKEKKKDRREQQKQEIAPGIPLIYDDQQREHEHQLYEIAATAAERYKTDNDPEPAIRDLEYVLMKAKPPYYAPAYMKLLTDLYVKTDQRDKAWAFLNFLLLNPDVNESSIRDRQAWLLKKEKKHVDAIEMLLYKHLADARNGYFSYSSLMKDIGVSVRALKWSSKNQDDIAGLVQWQIDTGKYSAAAIHTEYAKIVRAING